MLMNLAIGASQRIVKLLAWSGGVTSPMRPLIVGLVLAVSMVTLNAWESSAAVTGTFDKIEASFDLPQVQGNPFDFNQNDVKVVFVGPNGKDDSAPAFFDGGSTWRVRHTPTIPGTYRIRLVTLNRQDAKPQHLSPESFVVSGSPRHGFVRIDPKNPMRFAFDDASPYYPVGYDLGWRQMGTAAMPPLTESLARMGKAGVNWSRIWTCYWDGKNLDWSQSRNDQPPLGQLDLSAARRWDAIVDAATANGVYFQMVLQHHGQFSTHADANWQLNPWNKANGGWLDNAVQFFSDPKAIALTKSKFRYIIARWGYSPSIMAWELFNEVENADAFSKDLDAVAAWHVEMAAFVRQQDGYHHLITTSSHTNEPKLWPATDYYQSHVYAPDLLSAVSALDAEQLHEPYFYGEFGASDADADPNPSDTIHRTLWASLMSQSSGAAEYWFWYIAEPKNLLFHYTAAQKFLEQSALLNQSDMKPLDATIDTPERGALRFGPGRGWGPSKETTFTVKPSGAVDGTSGMSAFLQGQGANREMFPSATFNVNFPADGTFSVHVDQMTPAGARLEISVDGHRPVTLHFNGAAATPPPNEGRPQNRREPRLDTTIDLPISSGEHSIRMENTGADWIHLREFTLSPYAPALAVRGKANDHMAVVWIYRREQGDARPIAGKLSIPGLASGSYRLVWWDTYKAAVIKAETVNAIADSPLVLTTPPITQDVAAWIEQAIPAK